MITKSDFQSWKDHPVTIAYFDACKLRVEDAKDILANSAGLSSEDDNFTEVSLPHTERNSLLILRNFHETSSYIT